MAIGYELIKTVSARLYDESLRRIPTDTTAALGRAIARERSPAALATLKVMVESAGAAQQGHSYVCSDAGVPVYVVKVGTRVHFEGDVRRAIADGWHELVGSIQPPLLQHVTNPLTLERGYFGKDIPLVSFDLVDGVDYLDITCSPKALGSGRWAALEMFSFPSIETIENYVLEVVRKAGSQPCPPVVVGVGIGGTFDHAARIAKEAMLRPLGSVHAEPAVAAMEQRLAAAVNASGYGPMGTGGDSTAYAVHINYSSGHGFTPVAVCFNCWINRRTTARIFDSGVVQYGDGL